MVISALHRAFTFSCHTALIGILFPHHHFGKLFGVSQVNRFSHNSFIKLPGFLCRRLVHGRLRVPPRARGWLLPSQRLDSFYSSRDDVPSDRLLPGIQTASPKRLDFQNKKCCKYVNPRCPTSYCILDEIRINIIIYLVGLLI